MQDFDEADGPRAVSYSISSTHQRYFLRTEELGLVEGSGGRPELNPALQDVLTALHTVLAGGEVQVTITQAGNSSVVEELDTLFQEGFEEAKLVNERAGSHLAAYP